MSAAATPTNTTTPGIDIIDPSAILPVLCSPGFYQRMKQLGAHLVVGRPKQEIDEAHQLILQNKVQPETWQYQYVTVISFCEEYEKQVREKGLMRRVTAEEFQNLLGQEQA